MEVIRAQVKSQHPQVRLASVQALGQLGDVRSVPLLAQAMSAADTATERATIERAIVGLPGAEATDRSLVEALPQATSDAKPHLMSALAQRQARSAVPALLEESSSPTATVARAAFQALGRLATSSDLPALLDRLALLQAPAARPNAETAVARAMIQVESVGQRWEMLRQRLDQENDLETQLSLLRLLPNAPDGAARARLERAVQDTNPRIVDTALRALVDWPDLEAWGALVRVYREDVVEAHRVLALRGLVRLAQESSGDPSPVRIRRYRELLESVRRDEDRKLILGALGSVACPEALPLALAQLEIAEVRAEAELAVRQIAESIKAQDPEAAEAALQRLKD
jgi:hypothetical protein